MSYIETEEELIELERSIPPVVLLSLILDYVPEVEFIWSNLPKDQQIEWKDGKFVHSNWAKDVSWNGPLTSGYWNINGPSYIFYDSVLEDFEIKPHREVKYYDESDHAELSTDDIREIRRARADGYYVLRPLPYVVSQMSLLASLQSWFQSVDEYNDIPFDNNYTYILSPPLLYFNALWRLWVIKVPMSKLLAEIDFVESTVFNYHPNYVNRRKRKREEEKDDDDDDDDEQE